MQATKTRLNIKIEIHPAGVSTGKSITGGELQNSIMDGKAKQTAVARLRSRLADKSNIIVCPGVYDGFTARIALQAGFDCLYMVRDSRILFKSESEY